MKEKQPIEIVERKLHPVASELGTVDQAAQFEFLKGRTFYYQAFKGESCLVDLDEEPIHPLNSEALTVALQVSLLFNCKIPSEIQVMRKTVIDGSNTSGFQRTAVVGLNGYLEFRGKNVPISQISLEEDACAIVGEEDGRVMYKLNRLGVPLVEVSTGLLVGYTPEEIQEIAYMIGITCRSTGKMKHGIGSIRQDMNVSITKGARVEIKGVQELGIMAKIVEGEVKRQMIEKAKEETRTVLPDGNTKYMRPLPGASRMYPETDIPPVPVNTKYLAEIKKSLPEPLTKKLQRFEKELKLSQQLAKEILRSDYVEVFEKVKGVEPSIVASTFTNVVKDLERSGVEISNITDENFMDLFNNLAERKIAKEAIPDILRMLAENNTKKISEVAKKLGFTTLTHAELDKIIRETVKPDMPFNKAIGIVMSKVRGKADAQTVIKAVKKFLATSA